MTPEFRLVAACCRWPDDQARRDGIVSAARSIADWDRLFALAAAHRVEGLVANGLASAQVRPSGEVGARIEAIATKVRADALRSVAETLRLSRALLAAGIRHRLLKGMPLAAVAYGSPTVKQSWDIDLLVAPVDAVEAGACLKQLGYAPMPPARRFDEEEFHRWSVVTKEVEFRSAEGVIVELHWRLSDHPMLLRDLDPWAGQRDVQLLGDFGVPTLRDPENLAYLAVHGAQHGWARLKWLADFAAFVTSHAPAERAGLIAAARKFQPGRALDQGLALAAELVCPELSGLVQADAVAVSLAGLARDALAGRSDRDITTAPAVRRAQRAARWRLLDGRRYAAAQAVISLRGSELRKQLALPKRWWWAYWLLRPAAAAGRMIAKKLRLASS